MSGDEINFEVAAKQEALAIENARSLIDPNYKEYEYKGYCLNCGLSGGYLSPPERWHDNYCKEDFIKREFQKKQIV
jgi:hypothetical protein